MDSVQTRHQRGTALPRIYERGAPSIIVEQLQADPARVPIGEAELSEWYQVSLSGRGKFLRPYSRVFLITESFIFLFAALTLFLLLFAAYEIPNSIYSLFIAHRDFIAGEATEEAVKLVYLFDEYFYERIRRFSEYCIPISLATAFVSIIGIFIFSGPTEVAAKRYVVFLLHLLLLFSTIAVLVNTVKLDIGGNGDVMIVAIKNAAIDYVKFWSIGVSIYETRYLGMNRSYTPINTLQARKGCCVRKISPFERGNQASIDEVEEYKIEDLLKKIFPEAYVDLEPLRYLQNDWNVICKDDDRNNGAQKICTDEIFQGKKMRHWLLCPAYTFLVVLSLLHCFIICLTHRRLGIFITERFSEAKYIEEIEKGKKLRNKLQDRMRHKWEKDKTVYNRAIYVDDNQYLLTQTLTTQFEPVQETFIGARRWKRTHRSTKA